MQWDAGHHAGFCSAEAAPWLPVHENRECANVQDQLQDDDSLLNLYRRLLRLRRDIPILQTGTLELIIDPAMDKDILVYKRSDKDQTILVVLNFGDKAIQFQNPIDCQKMLLSISMTQVINLQTFQLPPYAGIILKRDKVSERE